MRRLTVFVICYCACWQLVPSVQAAAATRTERPNIVYILADDLGYGDVRAFNPQGKISTPNIDQLAREGMRFTDAHAGAACCTPTRYGVLTGRYAWRTRIQEGVCWGYSLPLIDESRLTVASLLKKQGYRTACVGKWHLGLQWGLKDDGKSPSDRSDEPWDNIDFTQPIASGPNQLGFDYFVGISASLDMHPHVYIENDRVTRVPTKIAAASGGKKFWRRGPIAADFQHVEVLDKLTEKAVGYIESQHGDTVRAMYGMPDGVTAYFGSHRNTGGNPRRFGLQIFGSKGAVEILTGYLPSAYFLPDPSWSPGRSGAKWVPISSVGAGKPEPLSGDNHTGNVVACRDLIDAIEQDRLPECNIHEGRMTVELIASVVESHRAGRSVELSLKTRKNPLTLL